MINKNKAEKIYKKSIQILKKVQLRNGGCLATPKGERYPYVYPRDHAICILGYLSAGMVKEAKKGLTFVLKGQLDNGAFPQRYDTKGNDASYKPIQIDGTGLILYALAEYYKKTHDSDFILNNWAKIENGLDYIVNNFDNEKDLIYTPNSVHEFPPTEDGLEIWANAICCAALNEISKIADKLKKSCGKWCEITHKVQAGLLKYMWNSRICSFLKTIRLKESSSTITDVDISPYALADFNVLPDKDEKIKCTVRRIEKLLWNKELGGICRYPKYEGRNNGGYGPWPHFTLMLSRHFIRLKDKKKADKYLNWVLKISYKDLLPEHISTVAEFEEYVIDFTEAGLLRKDRLVMIENARKHPMFKKGIAYITIPLAWPHAEFIRTWNLYKDTFL
ncbi:MAG TPA: glucoamylase [Candidatus Woesearchaeota archaeon]|jgi:GH15 family glucan-1,4-alpha-glucosidase|nr:glucoamylase [Candidatus Woesearchaeota archaeon]HJN56963.1 glucoamylase [Candidatus Woesearchaeota archaeon]|tara:strand:- start:7316 stop:8488 length:1173 start_codon:yes stop_codon:yes gene_type:complete